MSCCYSALFLDTGHKFTGKENWKSAYNSQITQMLSKKCLVVRIKGIVKEYGGQDQEGKEAGKPTWPSTMTTIYYQFPGEEGLILKTLLSSK